MTTTSAKSGNGIVLTYGGNAIAELLDSDLPNPKTNMIKTTYHGEAYHQSIPGQKDPGTIKVKGNFIPGDTNGQIVLMNARKNSTILSNLSIALPPALGCSCTFSAYVSEFKIVSSQKDQVTFEAVFDLTGEPVYGVTASSNLSGLTISVGTLSPAFAVGQYSYVDAVTNGTATVTVTPTNATAASITVNGTVVASGAASGAITTAVGTTTITIITTDTGKAPVVYVITVGRTA